MHTHVSVEPKFYPTLIIFLANLSENQKDKIKNII